MRSYVILNSVGQGLERRPYDGTWFWTNGTQFATPLTEEDAKVALADLDVLTASHRPPFQIVPDLQNRAPEPLRQTGIDAKTPAFCPACTTREVDADYAPYCGRVCEEAAERRQKVTR